jgi:hypothetical protein
MNQSRIRVVTFPDKVVHHSRVLRIQLLVRLHSGLRLDGPANDIVSNFWVGVNVIVSVQRVGVDWNGSLRIGVNI